MIGRTNAGGGGGGLNFKVVGGTTNPVSPSGNIIWVNTGTDITGWIFSATQPTSPTVGIVWFLTGTYSTTSFNALKKNGIQVYPISAKQYIGGAWVDKEAKSYQNGAWVAWIIRLYNNGDECVGATGGWQALAYARANANKDATKAPTVTQSGGVVTLEMQGQQWYDRNVRYSGGYFTKKKIDMASIKTLEINVTGYADNGFLPPSGGVTFGVTSALQDEFTPIASAEINAIGKYTLDVSNVTSACYVYVHIQNPLSGKATVSFDEISGR